MTKKYIDADLLKKDIERLNNLNKQIANEQGSTDFIKGITAGYVEVLSSIDSLQQKEQENKPNLLKSLEAYFEKTPKEQLDADWEKLKAWNKVEPDIETYCKALREHREVDLEKEIEDYWIATGWSKVITLGKFKVIARYFYGLGQLNSK